MILRRILLTTATTLCLASTTSSPLYQPVSIPANRIVNATTSAITTPLEAATSKLGNQNQAMHQDTLRDLDIVSDTLD